MPARGPARNPQFGTARGHSALRAEALESFPVCTTALLRESLQTRPSFCNLECTRATRLLVCVVASVPPSSSVCRAWFWGKRTAKLGKRRFGYNVPKSNQHDLGTITYSSLLSMSSSVQPKRVNSPFWLNWLVHPHSPHETGHNVRDERNSPSSALIVLAVL